MVEGEEDKVYHLKKALYGLKQAPQAWDSHIDNYFQGSGFVKCPYEHVVYIKKKAHGEILIACLYVDDLLFIETVSKCSMSLNKLCLRSLR